MPPTSKYTEPIVRTVAYYRHLTVQQVVRRYFAWHGLHPSNGYTRVKRLVSEGYLRSQDLDPELGNASLQTLSLADPGWRLLGHEPPSQDVRVTHFRDRLHHIQIAEAMMTRRVEGWQFIPRAEQELLVKAIRAHAIRHSPYRRDPQWMTRIRNLSTDTLHLPVHLLTHGGEDRVRLVLVAQTDSQWQKKLSETPSLALIGDVEWELVAENPELLKRMGAGVIKWAKAHGARGKAFVVPHFRQAPHPSKDRSETGSRWIQAGWDPLKDPVP